MWPEQLQKVPTTNFFFFLVIAVQMHSVAFSAVRICDRANEAEGCVYNTKSTCTIKQHSQMKREKKEMKKVTKNQRMNFLKILKLT